MRWERQLIDHREGTQLPGYRDITVRHFDAPEAVDTRFYEVHSKSILNRVPKASQVPFRWTINPYRGCSHACVYCLACDTRILMADGRACEIQHLSVGDRIVGTLRDGHLRRFVQTSVQAKWSSLKPAYAVDLDDGTRVVASADHRFLSTDGWQHVMDVEEGTEGSRSHLHPGTRLLGRGDGDARTSVSIRRVVSVSSLGTKIEMYDITTTTGDFIANGVVSHNCFARPTHEFLDMNAGRDFEREIVVKVNAPELLRVELARSRWGGEHVALGTNTDPYQWVEGRYGLMRGIWEALRDARNPCSVLTKSPLLLRDLDLMLELDAVTDFSAALSIPTLDQTAWRATEPRSPNPRARLDALAELSAAGIRTGVLLAPLMPGINDSPAQVREVVRLATEAGASYIMGLALHLRRGVREVFMEWLAQQRPELVPAYEDLYRHRAYMPPDERRRLTRLIGTPPTLVREHFRPVADPPSGAPSTLRRMEPEPEQQRLF